MTRTVVLALNFAEMEKPLLFTTTVSAEDEGGIEAAAFEEVYMAYPGDEGKVLENVEIVSLGAEEAVQVRYY